MLWETISLWGHVLASISFGVLVLWQTRQWFISHTGLSLVIAAAWTVIWALEVAILGNDALAARLAESVRDLAWLTYLMLLWRGHNRPLASYHAIRPLYWVSFGVLVLRIMVDLLPWQFLGSPRLMDADYYAGLMLRMVADIGGLVLVHNLYTAATSQSRNALRLPLAALALLWAYDLNANTIAYLARTQVYEMTALRGFILAPLPLLFLLGTMRAASAPVKLSRSATFQSLSLVAIGAYLVLMVGGSSLLRMFSEGAARGFQVSFAFLTALAALILLPNARLRAWSRVMLAKHFFQHRYDYRAEWLRFTNTLSRTDAAATSLDIRAIKAIADITESGAGLLLTPDASNGLIVRAQWNWPSPDAPTSAAGPQTLLYFQNTGRICALDAIRAGTATDEEAAAIPEWLLANNRAWVVVPLLHFSQLAGLVVLDRPMLDRELDWEDFDLLRLAGRQVASYLAEAQGQEALSDAQRFDEFNRRFAFIMHDIKNLVSQLSLVSRNAERHIGNPEFQQDMLATLAASTERMNALLARLSQHNKGKAQEPLPTRLAPLMNAIAVAKRAQHPVVVMGDPDLLAQVDAARLEQALSHLVQNAIEASRPSDPVTLMLRQDSQGVHVDVIDTGAGMTPSFIRDQLFKPFASTKSNGFGVGAHEARTLITEMGGALRVKSTPGSGTTFSLTLQPATSQLIQQEHAA